MAWNVKIESPAEKALNKLDKQHSKRILKFLFERIAHLDDPRSVGEALKGEELGDLWRYRVGDYRIIVDIEDHEMIVIALEIGHRKNVYK